MTQELAFDEGNSENSVIELFKGMGYTYLYGPDVVRDFYDPLYESELIDALYRINPDLPEEAIQDALFKLKNFENAELVQKTNCLWTTSKTEYKSAFRSTVKKHRISSISLTIRTQTITRSLWQTNGHLLRTATNARTLSYLSTVCRWYW